MEKLRKLAEGRLTRHIRHHHSKYNCSEANHRFNLVIVIFPLHCILLLIFYNNYSALDQLISQMRRLYGDMSFQVTRPNGTKSNAIVEVITLNRPWKLPSSLQSRRIYQSMCIEEIWPPYCFR